MKSMVQLSLGSWASGGFSELRKFFSGKRLVMLTSVGQAPFTQAGTAQPLFPSVSLQQSYIPPVQLPSAAPIMTVQAPQLTPVQFAVSTPQLTPRATQQQVLMAPLETQQFIPPMAGQFTPRGTQQFVLPTAGQLTPRGTQPSSLMASLQEEGRKLQPQVSGAVNRVSQEAQGFFRWLFAPIRR